VTQASRDRGVDAVVFDPVMSKNSNGIISGNAERRAE
jgi:hypothetical protein